MSGDHWSVTTWNLQGAKATDLDEVGRRIAQHAPDVVALQEVRRRQAEGLGELLGMSQHWSFKHHALTPVGGGRAEGAAILTPHRLGAPADAVISASTSRRSYRRRIAQWCLIEREDGSAIRVLNVHLSPHKYANERTNEAETVTRLASSSSWSEPVVVAGDFNDHGQPDVIAALPGIEHVPAPPTNPSDDPTCAIDHVLLPPEAHDVSASVPGGGDDWFVLSDHLPLTVRFVL